MAGIPRRAACKAGKQVDYSPARSSAAASRCKSLQGNRAASAGRPYLRITSDAWSGIPLGNHGSVGRSGFSGDRRCGDRGQSGSYGEGIQAAAICLGIERLVWVTRLFAST